MTSRVRLLPPVSAAGTVVVAARRFGSPPGARLAAAGARMLRAAAPTMIGSLAVALALSLVGANGGVFDRSPAIRIGVLASIGIAALLIWRSRSSATRWP